MFNNFLDICTLVFGVLIKGFGLYFFIISLFSFRSKRAYPKAAPVTRFCCVIAARNEEKVIGNIIQSIRRQDYPQELCDILVIPNNCTDNTESAALNAGAQIFKCTQNPRSKGDALHEAFEMLKDSEYDAFLIFDADNVLMPGYLQAMNEAFCTGAKITKSKIIAKNPYDSWTSGCYGLYFHICNTFFNSPRDVLGLSAKLIGTGFGVHRSVIQDMDGWNTETLAEDTEFYADLTLRDEKVCWVPDAVTCDEEPESFHISLRQRKRWASGIMSVFDIKAVSLLKEILKKKASTVWQRLDTILILLTPYLQALSFIPGAMLIISSIIHKSIPELLMISIMGIVGVYIAVVIALTVMVQFSPYRNPAIYKSILMFPVFLFSWSVLCLLSVFKRTKHWTQITHNG